MSRGGFTAHLASLRTAHEEEVAAVQTLETQAPAPAPDHQQLLASSTDLVFGHREKITAGVPGCTCGKPYPEDSHSYYPVLHAQHVAEEMVRHVLSAAVAAVKADREDFARDPSRWLSEGHDSLAAIEVVGKLARRADEQDSTREATAV